MQKERVGVYVDHSSVYANSTIDIDYLVLRDFALREDAYGVSLNIYPNFDINDPLADDEARKKATSYRNSFREIGFNVSEKEQGLPYEPDESGISPKFLVYMTVDMLEQARRLDRIVLVTGNGDFAPVVRSMRRGGVRVEVIAFDYCSKSLRDAADAVYPGLLIPGLVPVEGSRMRGIIDNTSIDGSDLGSIRYLGSSPSESLAPFSGDVSNYAIFHKDSINFGAIADLKGAIVEFDSIQPDVEDCNEPEVMATNITPIKTLSEKGWFTDYVPELSLAENSTYG